MSCAPMQECREVDADVVIVPLNKLALLTSFCHDRLASCFFLFFHSYSLTNTLLVIMLRASFKV